MGNNQSNHFPHIPGKITWYATRLSTVNHRRSSPVFFFRRAGGCTQVREPTHRRRLAHWKPFQEMMWWRYLLQLWLCLYFWLNSHWKPASSAIVFLYLLWFHVVYTSLLTTSFPGFLFSAS